MSNCFECLKEEKRAFTLVESLMGGSILVIGIASVLFLTTYIIKTFDNVKHEEIAFFLSQEGIEAIAKKIEDNYNRCPVKDDNLLGIWNCRDLISYNSNSGQCICSNVFSVGYYKIVFDGLKWDITPWDGLYSPVFYNCPTGQSCYYSDAKISSNTVSTIYSRKIKIDKVVDLNNDNYYDMMKVDSVVRWVERGGYKYVTSTMEFYNWRWRKE